MKMAAELKNSSATVKQILHYQRNIIVAKKENHTVEIIRCMKKLAILPIGIQELEETGIGKTINNLRKQGGEVGGYATLLVGRWKKSVREEIISQEEDDDDGFESDDSGLSDDVHDNDGSNSSNSDGNVTEEDNGDNSDDYQVGENDADEHYGSNKNGNGYRNQETGDRCKTYKDVKIKEENQKQPTAEVTYYDNTTANNVKNHHNEANGVKKVSKKSEPETNMDANKMVKRNGYKHSDGHRAKSDTESKKKETLQCSHKIKDVKESRSSSKKSKPDKHDIEHDRKTSKSKEKESSSHISSRIKKEKVELDSKERNKSCQKSNQIDSTSKHNSNYSHQSSDKKRKYDDLYDPAFVTKIKREKEDNDLDHELRPYNPSDIEPVLVKKETDAEEGFFFANLSRDSDDDAANFIEYKDSVRSFDNQYNSDNLQNDICKETSSDTKKTVLTKPDAVTSSHKNVKHGSDRLKDHRSISKSSGKDSQSSTHRKDKSSHHSSSQHKDRSSSHHSSKGSHDKAKREHKSSHDHTDRTGKSEQRRSKDETSKKHSDRKEIKVENKVSRTQENDGGFGAALLGIPNEKSQSKKKGEKSSSKCRSPSMQIIKPSPPSMNSPSSVHSSPSSSTSFIQNRNQLDALPDIKTSPLFIDEVISSSPDDNSSDYYTQQSYSQSQNAKRIREEEEQDGLVSMMTTKNQKTKVFSGCKSKSSNKLCTLFELCVNTIQQNIEALEYTGGVPYSVIKPVLIRIRADQLAAFEKHNSYLLEETDELWETHVKKDFRNAVRGENECWKELYERCEAEREEKLQSLRDNINNSIANSAPVRKTKLAYLDSYVKPPRNVAKKQVINGTSYDPRPMTSKRYSNEPQPSTSAIQSVKERLAAKFSGPEPVRSSSSSKPSTNLLKKKPAPLMQKALQLMKGSSRFRR